MNNELMFATGENNVETPDDFFELASSIAGQFVCDVAALSTNRKVANYIGPDHIDPALRDCLSINWPLGGPVWLNPPYGRSTKLVPGCYSFVAKAYHEAHRGVNVWLLLAARTDNRWWHDFVWDADHQNFYPWVKYRQFIRGRLTFKGRNAAAPFPSFLVQFCL